MFIYKAALTLLLSFSTLSLFAQSNGQIKAKIVDASGPLALANILLLENNEGKKKVKTTVTDSNGFFILKVPLGNYILQISNLGYEDYRHEAIDLTDQQRMYDLGEVLLLESNTLLEAVTITSKKLLIEQKADRLVMNVENSILAEGNTAMEILERAPGVMVDNDGNLSLRGKQGVSVLINGKQTYLSQKDLTNLLRGTSSASISAIEVITNPSAKYDAAGNSGIINIKMKKNLKQGVNGNAYINYGRGRDDRYGGGFNMNYSTELFNLYGSYDHAYRGEKEVFNFDRKFYDGVVTGLPSRISHQQSSTDEPLITNNFKLGVDYNLSAKTTLGAVVNGNIGSYSRYSHADNRIVNTDNELLSHAQTKVDNEEQWNSISGNLNVQHKFNEKGREITADIDFSRSSFDADQLLNTTFKPVHGNEPAPSSRRGYIPALTHVFAWKVDYIHPFNEQISLEGGLKSSFVKADNNANYDTLQNNNWVVDAQTTNHFIYKEQIHAGYLNYKHNLGTVELQLGLRGEYTRTSGHQLSTDSLVERNYFKLFPSVFIRKPLGENHKLQLSYSRRIDRPDYFDLNPFRFFQDPYLFFEGNPFLQPELTHSAELSYTLKEKYITSLFFSQTSDVMTSVITQIDSLNTSILRPQNLSSLRFFGASFTMSQDISSWWSTNNFVNLFKNEYSGTQDGGTIDKSIWSYTVNSQHTFKISDQLSAEMSGQYFSKSVYGLFERDGYYVVSGGLQQQLFKNKASIKLVVNDIFRTRKFNRSVNYQNIDMRESFSLDSRIGMITFSYRFGKKSNEGKPSRKRADDDVQQLIKGAG